jgi:transposase
MSQRELPLILFCNFYYATACSLLLMMAAAAATRGYASRFNKTAQHTSKLSGRQWVQELLSGHEDRIHNALGMHKGVFIQLVATLGRDAAVHDTRYVSAEEQIAIFLHYTRRGLSNRALQERFQRSADTVSKCINVSLNCFIN